jgi:probable nitrogen fixation protein
MQGPELHDRQGPVSGAFARELVHQLRLHADARAWDGKGDEELLAPLLATHGAEADDLDAERYFLVEIFHEAVAQRVEQRTGIGCAVMMRAQPDSSARVAILAGRLAVVSRELHDVHRFGFASLERLAEAGERLVVSAVEMIERFPDAAAYDS